LVDTFEGQEEHFVFDPLLLPAASVSHVGQGIWMRIS
jgi:hypothetical protein